MKRAARFVLPSLSLAFAAAFSAGCGSSDGARPGAGETTGITTQPILCAGRGFHAECTDPGEGPSPRPPITHPAPVKPVAPSTFPATVACATGVSCGFAALSNQDLSSIYCSPVEQFVESTSTSTSGYMVAYCNTVSTGLSAINGWIAQNPSAGASLVTTALPGLSAPPTNYAFLVFDTDPIGPAFPLPIACLVGAGCDAEPRSVSWDITTLPCSPTWLVPDGDNDGHSYMAAYCSTSGPWAAAIETWVAGHAQKNSASSGPSYPGLQTAAAGYTYIQFYPDIIGIHCDTCGGDGSGSSSGGSSSGGGTVQD